jgi:hypothetical protein
VALPPGANTAIGPLVVLVRRTAVIFVSELTVKRAALVPWNLTAVAPVKPEPRIVTVVPARPESGEKLEIVGGSGTVNGSALVAVPPGPVTVIGPVVEPALTMAVIRVSELTVKLFALVPWNLTALISVNESPVIVTLVPAMPLVGEKSSIEGAGGITVNMRTLVAVPPGPVIRIGPLVVPGATTAVIWVGESME